MTRIRLAWLRRRSRAFAFASALGLLSLHLVASAWFGWQHDAGSRDFHAVIAAVWLIAAVIAGLRLRSFSASRPASLSRAPFRPRPLSPADSR